MFIFNINFENELKTTVGNIDNSFCIKRPLYDQFSGGTHLFFSAKGVHTLQRLGGCELLDDDTPGPLRALTAFNGVKDSALQFNVQQKTLQIDSFWQQQWSQSKKEYFKLMFTHFYSPICIKFLKNCLHMKKNYVMRKGKIQCLA